MRDLQECQAEVFRRSEKRIKERKKRRNHILMLCIPLVLCTTIFGAFLLPNIESVKSADECAPGLAPENLCAGSGSVNMDGAFGGTVEVSGNGLSHLYTSAEDVQGIIDFIDGIVRTPKTNTLTESIGLFPNQSTAATWQDDYEDRGYRILIKQSDGTNSEYLLIGSLLINQSTQEEFHMSEDTYLALKEVLGIPFY